MQCDEMPQGRKRTLMLIPMIYTQFMDISIGETQSRASQRCRMSATIDLFKFISYEHTNKVNNPIASQRDRTGPADVGEIKWSQVNGI